MTSNNVSNSWEGVKVENNRVVELDLSYSGIDELPNEIGNLTALRKVDFSNKRSKHYITADYVFTF